MRVGLLTEYPVSQRTGWPTTVYRMRQALVARGHQVDLLFEPPAPAGAALLLHRLRRKRERLPLTAAQLALGAREADRRAAGADLILSVLGTRLLTLMRTAKPVVLVTDGTWKLLRAEYPEHRTAPCQNDDEERSAMRRAALQIYSSEWARASAVNDYGVPHECTSVVPLGANLVPGSQGFHADPPARGARCELLFVGRHWSRKGGDFAVATVAALIARGVAARLTTVGENPPLTPDLPHGAVRQLGWLEVERSADAKAYSSAFRAAHFLLLPTRADCTPIACAEASSFAVPTLACEVGGLRAMVVPGVNGFLLGRAASPADFADAVQRHWSDPQAYAALRRSSRAHFVQRLSWDAWATEVESILLGVAV